jgi:hypothetical protein
MPLVSLIENLLLTLCSFRAIRNQASKFSPYNVASTAISGLIAVHLDSQYDPQQNNYTPQQLLWIAVVELNPWEYNTYPRILWLPSNL